MTTTKSCLITLLLVIAFCSCKPTSEEAFDLKLVNNGQEFVIKDSLRILILGNSITIHPPYPQIGWTHNWGMAASAQDKDFVHILFKQINGLSQVKNRGVLQYGNVADFEVDFYKFNDSLIENDFKKYRDYNPDLVIFRLGDNVNDSIAAKQNFGGKLEEVKKYFEHNQKSPIFIITGIWFPRPSVDQQLQDLCHNDHIRYVSLNGLRWIQGLSAEGDPQYTDGGVAAHPSDKGMQVIADSIFSAFKPMVQ